VTVLPYGSRFARPELPIPLQPLTGVGVAFRRFIIGLREPSFAHAYRLTIGWGIVTLVMGAAGQVALTPVLRPAAIVLVAGLTIYLIVRIVSLAIFERRQHGFERRWLDAQSKMLRTATFEVLRCTVNPSCDARRSHEFAPGRVYDLTRPNDTHELLRRQIAEPSAHMRVEFAYRGSTDAMAVEQIGRVLRDIEFLPVQGLSKRARAGFAEARYDSLPPVSRGDRGRPGRTTYWLLGPLRLTVAAPSQQGDLVGTRVGTGRGDRPVAEFPDAARREERS
jgi:hypothetical protein